MRRGLKKRIELAKGIMANRDQVAVCNQEELGVISSNLQRIINEIDVELSDYVFESVESEITFFKTELAAVLSEYLYSTELLRLHIGTPVYEDDVKKYYKTKMKKYRSFKEKNINQFAYFRGAQSSEDHVLFVRSKTEAPLDLYERSFVNIPNQAFARAFFLAIEKLIPFLEKVMKPVEGVQTLEKPALRWTGTDVSAVELIYLLKEGKLINQGDVCIKELARRFDATFGTNLKDTSYRTLIDIKARKQEDPSIVKAFKNSYKLMIEAK